MINTLHKVIPGERLKVAAYARVSSDKDLMEASLNYLFFLSLIQF